MVKQIRNQKLETRKLKRRITPCGAVLLSAFCLLVSNLHAQSTLPPFRVKNIQGLTNLNTVRLASQFAGADAGAKIAAAIADLPTTGGMVVADFEGNQTISSDPFAGVIKPGKLILGETTFSVGATINIPSNWSLIGAYGGQRWGTYVVGQNRGTVFSWTGGTNLPVLKLFSVRDVVLQGFTIDGNLTAGSTGILLDSNNNPETHNIRIQDFNIYRTNVGIQWGTAPLPDPLGYEVDKIQIRNGVIDSVSIVGSKGIVLQGANKGQDSKIQAVTMVNVDTGIDLTAGNSYLDIEDCSVGVPVSSGHTDAIASIGVTNLTIKGGSSERNRAGAHFIHNISSSFNAGSQTTVIMNTTVNDPIVLEGTSKFLSIGNTSGSTTGQTISSISRTANVVTVTTAVAHALGVNDVAIVSGVTDTSFNGNFTVASVPSTTTFTYSQTAANATSSGGTALKSLAVINGTSNLKVTSIGDYLNNELGWTVLGTAQFAKLQESAASFPGSLAASSLTVSGASGDDKLLVQLGPASTAFGGDIQNGYLPSAVTYAAALNAPSVRKIALVGANENNSANGQTGVYGVSVATHTSGTKPKVNGTGGDAYSKGAGNITLLTGMRGFAEQDGAGTVTTMASLYALANFKSAGTVTANYGLYIEDQSGIGTSNYALFTAGSAPSQFGGAVISGLNTVAFSATPTFNASLGNTQKITLTANVTSSVLSNATAGETINFIICQDAVGGRTFVWPTNVLGAMTIGATASKCSGQSFVFDGTNAYALSAGVSNI